jgi:hypothetical protein
MMKMHLIMSCILRTCTGAFGEMGEEMDRFFGLGSFSGLRLLRPLNQLIILLAKVGERERYRKKNKMEIFLVRSERARATEGVFFVDFIRFLSKSSSAPTAII